MSNELPIGCKEPTSCTRHVKDGLCGWCMSNDIHNQPYEITAHWECGSALLKLNDGTYRIRRGNLSDGEYIRQLEGHVISKHNALLMTIQKHDAINVMYRSQPVCADCWDNRCPSRLASRIAPNSEPERCVVCDRNTFDGIWVRMKVEWA